MNQTDLISVLVPFYNTEKYLAKTLDSIVNQTYKNLEIVLLDDGSVDNSYNIAKSFADKDERIKLFHKENEKSISKTRNYLLNCYTGNYVVWVDSDDLIDARYVERLKSVIDEHNADMATCEYSIKIKNKTGKAKAKKRVKVFENSNIVPHMVLNKDIHFVLWNKMFKKDILQGITFNENVKTGEDLFFCIDCVRKCKKVVSIKDKLYHYILRAGSESHQKFKPTDMQLITELQKRLDAETDNVVCEVYKSWLSFSSCVFLFLANKRKYKEECKILKKYAYLYKSNLLHNPETRRLYRFFERFVLLFNRKPKN